MMQTIQTRYVNIIVQLPNKRLILHKTKNESQWAVSFQKIILPNENVLTVANNIFRNIFNLDPINYRDSDVEIMQRKSVMCQQYNAIIHPFTAKIKSTLSFEVDPGHKFISLQWKELLKDVMANSIYVKVSKPIKHTQVAITIVRALQQRGIITE